jgi:hypothetical protein
MYKYFIYYRSLLVIKTIWMMPFSLILASCANNTSGEIGLAKNSEFGMWTSLPRTQVQECIARQTGGTLNGSAIFLTQSTRYTVTEASNNSLYPTEVNRFGPDSSKNEQKVINCILPS